MTPYLIAAAGLLGLSVGAWLAVRNDGLTRWWWR